jgi:lysophospholipase L1-like esterase
VLGDSAAAGVGAPHQSAALAGRLVARLSRHATVDWLLCARTGATTDSTRRTLSEMPAREFDVAVTSLGVNDAIAGTPIGRWRQDQRALREQLKTSFRVESILVSGLPPVSQFPALPQPLRWFLGRRCRALDGALARDVADDPMSAYLPLDFLSDVEWMAEDGFHPGPVIYDAWAGELASRIISGA